MCKFCEQCYYHYVEWIDDQMTKLKVVDLEKLWNYVVDNFLIWNHLVKENYVWIFKKLKFEFLNDLGWTNRKTKVVDLKKLWNFVVGNFLIWNHFVMENYVWIS
jgi:hypothetical protein